MKKILFISSLIALMASGPSCSDTYDIYPDEYADVVMIKDAGERPLTIYSTDDKVPCKFTVMKGGHTPGEASATLRVMTNEEFTAYQTESGRPYAMLSADCYSFSPDAQVTSAEVKFAPNETYKEVEVYVDADALGAFMENFDGSVYSPVVPLVLESPNVTVNAEGSEVFIVANYTEPTLLFHNPGWRTPNRRGISVPNNEFTVTVELPIENQWDITFDIAVDQADLDRYNAEHGTAFEAIPSSLISGETTYTLPAGTSSVDVKLNLDINQVISTVGFNAALPIRITRTNIEGIVPDENESWFIATVAVPLTAEMLSTNAPDSDHGVDKLLDGDASTYFGTDPNSSVEGRHWLQIMLPEKVSTMWIIYQNRMDLIDNIFYYMDLWTGTSENNLTLGPVGNGAYGWDVGDYRINYNPGAETTLLNIPASPANIFRIESAVTFTSGGKNFDVAEIHLWAY